MVGKWHVGLSHPKETPHGRGFDTSKGYLTAAEDHWTQAQCGCDGCSCPSTASFPPNPLAAAPSEEAPHDAREHHQATTGPSASSARPRVAASEEEVRRRQLALGSGVGGASSARLTRGGSSLNRFSAASGGAAAAEDGDTLLGPPKPIALADVPDRYDAKQHAFHFC